MPAQRLPWFKMWPEAMIHEKVALLPDPVFRTWVMALSSGSQQPVRGRFASAKHVAVVTGRPLAHVRQLVAGKLLDESDDGSIMVHDWRAWQDVHPSDFAPRSTPERSANAPRTLRDDPAKNKKREEEEDTESSGSLDEGGAGGTNGADAPPTAKAEPKAAKRSGPKTAPPDDLEPSEADYEAGKAVGLTPFQVGEKASAMLDHFRGKGELRADWHATLRTWLRNAPKFDQRAPPVGATRNGTAAHKGPGWAGENPDTPPVDYVDF